MTGPVTPEAPHGPCGICERCCEASRIAWADQGGLHFFDAVERVGGCENGWGAPAPPDPAASRDRLPSQPVAERVAATETGGTEAPGETVVASSSCAACSAMRERAESAEAVLRDVEAGIPSGGLCPICGSYRLIVRGDPTPRFHHIDGCRLARITAGSGVIR